MTEHAPKEHVESVFLPEDHDADTGHVYDGIAELDHRLPAWWLFTLWATIAFAIVYWAYYHTTGMGPSSKAVYLAEYDEVKQQEAAREAKLLASGEGFTDAALKKHSENAEAVARGKDVYMTNCQACHRADGGGLIGPNLTDDATLHGASLADIYKVVSEGVVAKGMPAWKPVLGVEKTRDVVAFIATLPDAVGGKEPQGTAPGGATGATGGPSDAPAVPPGVDDQVDEKKADAAPGEAAPAGDVVAGDGSATP